MKEETVKNIAINILIVIFIFTVFYLSFSFCIGEMNPFTGWHRDSRIAYMATCIGLSSITIFFKTMDEKL